MLDYVLLAVKFFEDGLGLQIVVPEPVGPGFFFKFGNLGPEGINVKGTSVTS